MIASLSDVSLHPPHSDIHTNLRLTVASAVGCPQVSVAQIGKAALCYGPVLTDKAVWPHLGVITQQQRLNASHSHLGFHLQVRIVPVVRRGSCQGRDCM